MLITNELKMRDLENGKWFCCYNNGTNLLVSDLSVYIIEIFRGKSHLPQKIEHQLRYIDTGVLAERDCPFCGLYLKYLKCTTCSNISMCNIGKKDVPWISKWIKFKLGVKVKCVVECFVMKYDGRIVLRSEEMKKPIYFCLRNIGRASYYVQMVNNIFVQIEVMWRKLKKIVLFMREICGSKLEHSDIFIHFLVVVYTSELYDYTYTNS